MVLCEWFKDVNADLHGLLGEGVGLGAEVEEGEDLGGADIGDGQAGLRHRRQRRALIVPRWGRHIRRFAITQRRMCRLELQETAWK